MSKNIMVINGHPDPSPERFVGALTTAYLTGANRAGHRIRRLDACDLDLPAPRSEADINGPRLDAAATAYAAISWADHLVLLYPLWLGGPPARLKAFCEHVFRASTERPALAKTQRSARLVITVDRPPSLSGGLADYVGLRAVARNMLAPAGFQRVRFSVFYGEDDLVRRGVDVARLTRYGADGL